MVDMMKNVLIAALKISLTYELEEQTERSFSRDLLFDSSFISHQYWEGIDYVLIASGGEFCAVSFSILGVHILIHVIFCRGRWRPKKFIRLALFDKSFNNLREKNVEKTSKNPVGFVKVAVASLTDDSKQTAVPI